MVPVTVLYVEDEESDLLFMQRAFAKAGLGTVLKTVQDGRAALDYLAGNGDYADRARYPLPAVVLLDLNLPLVSGFDVLAWVRLKPEFKTLPVVVFTSSSREADKRKAHELGADDYEEKPNSGLLFSRLVQRLRERWLGGAGGGGIPTG